jgi:DNA (cytosine-5)-methyltransferase 1
MESLMPTDDLLFLRSRTRPSYEDGKDPSLVLVDLFSGCGGMSLGMMHAAHKAGFSVRIPLALDNDGDAVEVYRRNFPKANCVHASVSEWFDGDLEQRTTRAERKTKTYVGAGVDFLLAGPPCQGNSDLNNHSRRDDPRNALYARVARAARILDARILVIENVPAVLHDRGNVVGLTMRTLEKSGYKVADGIIDLQKVGVPQKRRRHILIATCDSLLNPVYLLHALQSELGEQRDVRWAIGDLHDLVAKDDFDRSPKPGPDNARRIRWLFDHDEYDLPDEERPPCHRNKAHSYRSIYGRLRWDQPAQTITTGFGCMGQGRYVHPGVPRTLTPHEAARLQCFPDFFSFRGIAKRTGWARLIGNAVPPLLTMRIGEQVLDNESTNLGRVEVSQKDVAMDSKGPGRDQGETTGSQFAQG